MRTRHTLSALGLAANSAALVFLLSACSSFPDGESVLESQQALLGQGTIKESEPNGTPMQANPIGNNNAVIRAPIYALGDVDVFSFSANMNDVLYAGTMTSASPNSQDSVLELLAPDGTTLLESDDDNGSFSSTSSVIAGKILPMTGTYFLRLQQKGGTGHIRPYDLHHRVQSGMPALEAEPNNGLGQATPLPASGWAAGALADASDVDVFSLALNAGDTVFVAVDADPERDNVQWNPLIAFGPFNNVMLQVNDMGGAGGPDAEAFYGTVKAAGTYNVSVASAPGSNTFGTYSVSVSVHPAVPATVKCTTYTTADMPQMIPAGGGTAMQTITIPGNPRIADLDISLQFNHADGSDIDAYLISPAGNSNGIFTDVGSPTFPNFDFTLDDEAGIPVNTYTALSGLVLQSENSYRLHWFDGENAGGTWTLVLDDDTANMAGGTLTSFSLTVCEPPAAPTCNGGTMPIVPFMTDFEAGASGFTHSGQADEWELGMPTAAPITGCNSGNQCWKTDLDNTYDSNSNQNLVSPSIDLSLAMAPIRASWAMKYQMDSATNDSIYVEIREVGGANPRRIYQFLDGQMQTPIGAMNTNIQESAGWGIHEADISDYAGKMVELVFHVDSSANNNFGGLAVDDIKISGCALEICGNGVIEGGETCDDGNTMNGDGCSSVCQIEGMGTGGSGGSGSSSSSGGSSSSSGGTGGAGGAGGTGTGGSGTGGSGMGGMGSGGSGMGGAGTGGNATGGSGSTGSGKPVNMGTIAEDTGCGCQLPGSNTPAQPWLLSMGLLGLLGLRRRRG